MPIEAEANSTTIISQGQVGALGRAEANTIIDGPIGISILCLKPEIPVRGRLRHFLPFWEEYVKDQWVLGVVRWGYCLEFLPPVFPGDSLDPCDSRDLSL